MSDIQVRRAQPSDRPLLADLLHALWPESSVEDHGRELDAVLAGKALSTLPPVIYVAAADDQSLVGFLEAGLRSHSDSCDPAQPVGYVEGWYVVETHRHRGIGKKLLGAAEDWARRQGCTEMASDTRPENELSQRVHQALGFQIVERAIIFRKALR